MLQRQRLRYLKTFNLKRELNVPRVPHVPRDSMKVSHGSMPESRYQNF
jgi:hypothetical protein